MSSQVVFLLGLTQGEASSSVEDAEPIRNVAENLKDEHRSNYNQIQILQKIYEVLSTTDTISLSLGNLLK
jgi:hypothetical protein